MEINVIDIEAHTPHKVSIVVCLKCLRRWVAVRPETVKLVDLECALCKAGYVIETGEVLEEAE